MPLVIPTAAVTELILTLRMPTVIATQTTSTISPPISTTAPYNTVLKKNNVVWLTASLINPIRKNHKLSSTCQEDNNGDKLLCRNGTIKFQKAHNILIVKESSGCLKNTFTVTPGKIA
jgi:hypothetical protein